MSADLVTIFRSLADATRLRLLNLLVYKGELCVCDMERALETGQPQISRHLAYLKNSGWVQPRRAQTWVFYSIRDDLAESASATLQALRREWERAPIFRPDGERLDRLIDHGSCHWKDPSGNVPAGKRVADV